MSLEKESESACNFTPPNLRSLILIHRIMESFLATKSFGLLMILMFTESLSTKHLKETSLQSLLTELSLSLILELDNYS